MDKLDDTSRANVLETMFGKSRSAAGAALLSGMKESASAYEDAINSAGSATEEYQTWMTSADAACQRFSNTLTETYQSTHTDVGGEWFLSGDASEQGVLKNYKTIEKALEALRDSNKFTQEELSQNDLFKELYDRYNTVKEAAESYDSEIDNLNENLAQQTMLTALQGNELPKTEEDFNKFKQELIDTAVASKQFIGNEKEITDAINKCVTWQKQFKN